MTVIVAAHTKRDGIVVAADSEIHGGWEKGTVSTPKVWVPQGTDRVMGFAGSVRTGQVIKHLTEWPELWPDLSGGFGSEDVERFLVRDVWPSMRATLEANGCLHTDKGIEHIEAEFLIAWGGTLARVEADGCVLLAPHGRDAIGSGYAEALGHLGDTGPWTKADVIEAVRRASKTAIGVGGPIWAASTVEPTVERVE